MNRRDFLRPRHLTSTAGQLLGAVDELRSAIREAFPPDEVAGPEFALLRFSRRAMATTFEVMLPYGLANAQVAAEAALDEIDRLESQLTVYRDTSEVSRLNRAAPYGPVSVEEQLFGLLEKAAAIHGATHGAFDIAAGAIIKAWGFFRPPRRVPSDEELAEAMSRVGMKHVVLDLQNRTVCYLRPGLEINLGAIGKGYALDRVAALLRDGWNLSSGLLHGGHSSVYAIGTEPESKNGWLVGITHPWNLERRIATVRLRDQALGTSSATFRHLEHNGRKIGHILDPRTGRPVEGMALTSVIAQTAAEADALATAFYVLGIEKARAYCEAHPEIGAVLLPEWDEAVPVFLGLARRLARPV